MWNPFKRIQRDSITIVLKNGQNLKFRTEKFKVTFFNGECTGYSFENAKGDVPLFVNIGEIAAVIQH